MARILAIALHFILVAGVSVENAVAQSLANRPALNLTGAQQEGGADFARTVAARYEGIAAPAVRADAHAQGFVCSGDGSYCTRVVMDGPCANAWIIDIAADQSVSGRRERQCMGAEEE